jgi:diacylglycerol kinase family enzyme
VAGGVNVLAGKLDLPGGIDRLADVFAAKRTRRVSVGRAGRYFPLMAGVGLDADIVRAVTRGSSA